MTTKILKLLPVLLLSTLAMNAQNVKQKQINETSISPKIFVVLDITVHDTAMYEQYRIKVEDVIAKFGGKYLVRSGSMAFDKDPDRKVVPVEGNWNPDRFIIVLWNSIEQLQRFSTSEEYKSVAKLRENSASTKAIMVKEYR